MIAILDSALPPVSLLVGPAMERGMAPIQESHSIPISTGGHGGLRS